MFYLGVYLEEGGQTARVVAVEKTFFSGSKRYRLVHAELLQHTAERSLTKALLDMRLDERFTAVKKVFSQSGRPAKIKKEPPLILLSSWDDGVHMAEELRGRCASVEVIVSAEPDEAFRQRLRADAFHNCHVVTCETMVAAIREALEKGRLPAGQLVEDVPPLLASVGRDLLAEPESRPDFAFPSPWLIGLGSCIWHGESIRRIKRY